jgi:hypothetical protein
VNRRRSVLSSTGLGPQVPEWSAEQLAAAYPVVASVGLPEGLGPGLVAALRAL